MRNKVSPLPSGLLAQVFNQYMSQQPAKHKKRYTTAFLHKLEYCIIAINVL